MLFAQRFAEPIARGEVDLTFRRWKRPLVRPGRPYRTLVGRLEVDEVAEVEPDPRSALAATPPSSSDADEIAGKLDATDRRSSHGPWAWATLRAIAADPGRRAPDLAAAFGRETAPFKVDVRKLRALGLTLSLPVGYELSPRGQAVLASRDRRRGR